jgi:hypothetical protein
MDGDELGEIVVGGKMRRRQREKAIFEMENMRKLKGEPEMMFPIN